MRELWSKMMSKLSYIAASWSARSAVYSAFSLRYFSFAVCDKWTSGIRHEHSWLLALSLAFISSIA